MLEKEFSSPSYAAVYCMQNAGSKRKTINGWTAWQDKVGDLLADLRQKLVDKLNQQDGDGS